MLPGDDIPKLAEDPGSSRFCFVEFGKTEEKVPAICVESDDPCLLACLLPVSQEPIAARPKESGERQSLASPGSHRDSKSLLNPHDLRTHSRFTNVMTGSCCVGSYQLASSLHEILCSAASLVHAPRLLWTKMDSEYRQLCHACRR